MPVFKFRVSWQEDENIQRDIEIQSSNTFEDLHQCIKKTFLLKEEWQATFGVLNEVGKRTYSLDTKIDKNIKGASFLSTKRTPVGALVTHPSQEFVYALENPKEWDFLINLITIDKSSGDRDPYPRVVRVEGVSPMEVDVKKGSKKEKLIDIEDKYDLDTKSLNGDDDDEGGSGFTIEGDDSNADDFAAEGFGAEE